MVGALLLKGLLCFLQARDSVFFFGGREWNVHYQNFTLGGIAMKRPPNSHSHYLGGGGGVNITGRNFCVSKMFGHI